MRVLAGPSLVPVVALTYLCCMTLSKLLNLSGLSFCMCKMERKLPTE